RRVAVNVRADRVEAGARDEEDHVIKQETAVGKNADKLRLVDECGVEPHDAAVVSRGGPDADPLEAHVVDGNGVARVAPGVVRESELRWALAAAADSTDVCAVRTVEPDLAAAAIRDDDGAIVQSQSVGDAEEHVLGRALDDAEV